MTTTIVADSAEQLLAFTRELINIGWLPNEGPHTDGVQFWISLTLFE